MRRFGFSTGSLAKGDFRAALEMTRRFGLKAVELSALREEELPELLNALVELDLSIYDHVSLPAPSKLISLSEAELCEMLAQVVPKYSIVVHPDIISESRLWRKLGRSILIENMDKRKPCGRTADELATIFHTVPEARLCFDIGHCRQVDPSLCESRKILRELGDRLAQVHLSEVNSSSGHERLNRMAIDSFQRIARFIPEDVPIILETPISDGEIERELERAREVFDVQPLVSV